jgi:hypothetical protein
MSSHKVLLEQPAFGPDEVKLLSEVFEDAWSVVAPEFNGNSDAARTEMAQAILELAKSGQRDAGRLKTYALARTRRMNGAPA